MCACVRMCVRPCPFRFVVTGRRNKPIFPLVKSLLALLVLLPTSKQANYKINGLSLSLCGQLSRSPACVFRVFECSKRPVVDVRFTVGMFRAARVLMCCLPLYVCET